MQTVYVETSIVSYLAGKPSRDLLMAACQQATWTWWDDHRHHCELYTSQLVVAEVSRGDPELARKRLGYLRAIPQLRVTSEIRDLAKALVRRRALPEKAGADALHIAIGAAHHIDLLLTWNCRHIDNPTTKPLVRSACAAEGYTCPEICTPLEILEAMDHEE